MPRRHIVRAFNEIQPQSCSTVRARPFFLAGEVAWAAPVLALAAAIWGVVITSTTFAQQQAATMTILNLAPRYKVTACRRGEVKGSSTLPSEAYQGTQHTYWVYVRQGANIGKAAHLILGRARVSRSRGQAQATNVIDNLVHQRQEIRVMLAVFVEPGADAGTERSVGQRVGDRSTAGVRRNLMTSTARVICDELSELKKLTTFPTTPRTAGSAGAAPGQSRRLRWRGSGPEEFSKVLSIVGSFTIFAAGTICGDLVARASGSRFACFWRTGGTTTAGAARRAIRTKPGIGSCRTSG